MRKELLALIVGANNLNFEITKHSAEEWKQISEDAFSLVFNEFRPFGMNRIDYALVAVETDSDEICGFITCKELDGETVYWQHGGALPKYQKRIEVYRVFLQFLEWSRNHGHTKILTYVKNDNTAMLKFYMSLEAKIIGVKYINGEIFLEHLIEL